MSQIYVTGGTGFIGKAVVTSLIDAGHRVRLLGRQPPADSRASFRAVDLTDLRSVDATVRSEQPETLIHLAWDVTHGDYWNSDLNATWVTASRGLVQAFAANGGRRLVVAGTCAEDTPTLSSTPYARAKSDLRRSILEIDGLQAAWIKIFFPVGPHEDPNRLVPSLVRSMTAGEVFHVRHPSLVRDFCSVRDVGSAFAAAASGLACGVYEVGSGTGMALGDVSRVVAESLDSMELLDFGASSDPDPLIASTESLVDDYGWRAMVSPRDALLQAVEWWKDRA